jgi:hypothetical protein
VSGADFNCISWGDEGRVLVHPDCDVVVVVSGVPRVCPCECRTCKRAWFDAGQPIVRDGNVVRR